MISLCKHCKQQFDLELHPKGWMANHSRWCTQNPKRQIYLDSLDNTRSFVWTDKFRERISLKIKQYHKEGKYNFLKNNKPFLGKHHSIGTKEIMKIKALASNHRRLKKNVQYYKGIMMDSSWEVELAKKMDYLNINWIRPNFILWTDNNGLLHHYFPDFYLPDYNVYLDPKNPHAYNVQIEKIKLLNEQYDNILFITSLKEIKEFNIASILALPSKQ